jgi:hypothetical protein
MTSEVIDAMIRPGCARPMDTTHDAARFDTVLRAVIRTDALLSAALAVVAVLSPVVIVLPVPPAAVTVIGLGALAVALLLAGLGAVTAVLLVARMRAGHGHIPAGLRLPLPAAMRPDTDDRVSPRAPGSGCSGSARTASPPRSAGRRS